MTTNYVRGASVTCSALQTEIRDMLLGSGARGFRFVSVHGNAGIAFSAEDRTFRLVLPLPASGPAGQDAARQCWRQLSLLIRAKLAAVDSGIVTFHEEFLAYMVMPGGGTVSQASAPGIAAAYDKAAGSVVPRPQ